MRRRPFVRAAAGGSVAGLAGLAGCSTRENDEDPDPDDEDEDVDADGLQSGDGPLRVATYTSMVTGEDPAGERIAERFAEAFPDADLEWTVPASGIDHYVNRARLDAEIDADVYLGVTVEDLVLAAGARGGPLFEPLDRSRLERDHRVRDDLAFDDPDDRAIPFGRGYVTPVYDDRFLDAPETLDDLLEAGAEDALLVEDPRYSAPGRAFLLWTVATYGDDYLAYWRDLRDHGLVVADSWTDAYREGYREGAGSAVISYSTDRVAAVADGRDLDRHQVATPDGEGYRSVEGVAVFAETDRRDLAYGFVDVVLSAEAQVAIAERNLQYPAVEAVAGDLGRTFHGHAVEPDEAVSVEYDDLSADLETWLGAWADAIAD